MFLYTSGSTGRPKGVVLSHYSHLWVMSQRVRRPGPYGQRVLVAAPLYHMNGLAMCQTTFSHGDTIVLLPQFTTRGYVEAAARHRVALLTSVPTMIAMMLRERELAGGERSQRRRRRAHGLGADHAGADRPGAQRLSQGRRSRNGYGTTEAGPVVFGPHPEGIRQPELSTGYPHPEVQLRLVRDGREVEDEGVLEMKCGGLMTHYHKLPEVTAQGDDAGRLLPHRRRVPPRRRTASSSSSAAPTTCSCAAARTSIPARSRRCWSAIPASTRRRSLPVPDELKGHKPVAFVVQAPGADARRAGGQGLRARQRAGLSASAPCLLRRRDAARRHQQDRQAACWPGMIPTGGDA